MKYTSKLQDSVCELKNCSKCKGILDCKNKVCGYAYLPRIQEDELVFSYKPCKYKEKMENETKHLNETIKYNDASLHIVYDLNRLEIYVNGEVEVGGNVSNTPNEYETRIKRHLGIPRVKRV